MDENVQYDMYDIEKEYYTLYEDLLICEFCLNKHFPDKMTLCSYCNRDICQFCAKSGCKNCNFKVYCSECSITPKYDFIECESKKCYTKRDKINQKIYKTLDDNLLKDIRKIILELLITK